MAFAVHVNINRCTGCGNCASACPVNALKPKQLTRATKDKIYTVRAGKSISLDVKSELCPDGGVCVWVGPYQVMTLSGRGDMVMLANI